MAVSGRRIGPLDGPPAGELGMPGDPGTPSGGGGAPGAGGRATDVLGPRMMKHAGPAFRWLAWAAVGLRVVLA